MNKNRLQFNQDTIPSFIFMHIVFFAVQLFFFWIYFSPTPFTEWNIPVIYYKIQTIGYPTVLICSLILLNRHFFPGETKYIIVSILIFLLEWFHIDKLLFAHQIAEDLFLQTSIGHYYILIMSGGFHLKPIRYRLHDKII